MLCHVILRSVPLRYVTLSYGTLCYYILYYLKVGSRQQEGINTILILILQRIKNVKEKTNNFADFLFITVYFQIIGRKIYEFGLASISNNIKRRQSRRFHVCLVNTYSLQPSIVSNFVFRETLMPAVYSTLCRTHQEYFE